MQQVNQVITARSLVSCAVRAQASLALSPPCWAQLLSQEKTFHLTGTIHNNSYVFVFQRVRTVIFHVRENRTGCLQYKIFSIFITQLVTNLGFHLYTTKIQENKLKILGKCKCQQTVPNTPNHLFVYVNKRLNFLTCKKPDTQDEKGLNHFVLVFWSTFKHGLVFIVTVFQAFFDLGYWCQISSNCH